MENIHAWLNAVDPTWLALLAIDGTGDNSIISRLGALGDWSSENPNGGGGEGVSGERIVGGGEGLFLTLY